MITWGQQASDWDLEQNTLRPAGLEYGHIPGDRSHNVDYLTWHWKAVYHFCNIYTVQRDTQCSCTDWVLLVLRCQLYMFRTVTVHPQELLFRYCMCRLWYVVRNALSDTSSWYKVVPAGHISTYHSLHIQYLQRSSWGWTVTVRNM